MKTNKQQAEDYKKYRGKCKEFCEELVKTDPSLELIRGHYYCPLWGKQAHWWCVKPDGTIVDPTVRQFPTNGAGATYEPFSGIVECAQCGTEIREEDVHFNGNYACCSYRCAMLLVGL